MTRRSWLGAVDTTVHITKTTAGRLAEVVKSSNHEEGQRVAFFLKGVTVDTDEQGDPITAPVVIEAMAGVAPKKKVAERGQGRNQCPRGSRRRPGRDPAGVQPYPARDQGGDHGSMAFPLA